MQLKLRKEKRITGALVGEAEANLSVTDLTRLHQSTPSLLRPIKVKLFIFVAANILKIRHFVMARITHSKKVYKTGRI
jgi:hypothetical protein